MVRRRWRSDPLKDHGFLDELSGKALRGKSWATFDTQIKMPLSGNAVKGIEKRLVDLEGSIFRPHLISYFKGKGKNTWKLRAGETDKVKTWARKPRTCL
ncbi:MAG: hypothetical protein ACUVQ5_06410 [Candidatus Methanomethylicaceae archaeon]